MTRGGAVSLNNHLSPTSSPPPSPPPPPPEVSGDPPKNPWRINHAGGCATAVSVTLVGEPSSDWPPLSSQRPMKGQSNSPPPPPAGPEPPTVIHQSVAVKTEDPIAGDLTPSPSSSSPDHASCKETSIPTTEFPATAVMETPVSPPPPPLAPLPQLAPAPPLAPSPPLALVPPPFSSNAAATAAPPRSPRHPAPPPARRGRGQRFNHHRGSSSSSGYRNHNGAQNNRAPNPGWRPNWSSIPPPPPPPPPQHPNWGFYPGTVPPADANSYFVPYLQGYNDMVLYQDYVMDPYGNYYDYSSYEMPYPTPLSPVVSDPVTLQVAPSFSTVATLDHGVGVKDALLAQIEYYFSDINLHKDTYLKSLMDSEGWVDIHEIAKFRKVKAQTEKLSLIEDDCINFIKDALQSSKVLELQGDKIRRHEWHQWISQQSSQNPLVVSMQSIRLAD